MALDENYKFEGVPYAANIRFEVYKKGIYYVKTLYNGIEFPIPEPYCSSGSKCFIDEWLEFIRDKLLTDPKEIDNECAKVPTKEENFR